MIVTLGESVYDILFSDGQPVAAAHGGSMYNVAVSLGRSGVATAFAGFYAEDMIGNKSLDFLTQNHVATDYFRPVPHAKSNLALAFLNDRKVPEYTFYRNLQLRGHPFSLDFASMDCLVIGSFYAIDNENFNFVKKVVNQALMHNVKVVYDPNIRSKHLHETPDPQFRISYLMQSADLVKMSAEDLYHITGSNTFNDWHQYLQSCSVNMYIITNGHEPVSTYFHGEQELLNVAPVSLVSTVGAGDAFTAGMLSKGTAIFDHAQLFVEAAKTGIAYGRHVCTLTENYISEDAEIG